MPILNTQRVYNSATYVVDYDPSDINGEGLVAGLNSVATLSPSGQVYVKTGLGDFDWTLVVEGAGPASPWIQNGNNIYFAGGDVGIGITDPQYPLDVDGIINANGHRVIGVAEPVDSNDTTAATPLGYIQDNYLSQSDAAATFVRIDGASEMTGDLKMGHSSSLMPAIAPIESGKSVAVAGNSYSGSAGNALSIEIVSDPSILSLLDYSFDGSLLIVKYNTNLGPCTLQDLFNFSVANFSSTMVIVFALGEENTPIADQSLTPLSGGQDASTVTHYVKFVTDPSAPQDAMTLNYADNHYVSQSSAPSTYAYVDLHNLSSTSINADLNPAADLGASIGQEYQRFAYAHAQSVHTSSIEGHDFLDIHSPVMTMQSDSTLLIAGSTSITLNSPDLEVTGQMNMQNHKIVNVADGTTTYDAVNFGQLTSGLAGLIWQPAIVDPDIQAINLNDPPTLPAPVYSSTYIIGIGTGVWAGYDGHVVWWDGNDWIDVSTGLVLGVEPGLPASDGDRFGVAFNHYDPNYFNQGTVDLSGSQNHIITLTGSAGAFTLSSDQAPVNNWAVSVIPDGSQHTGESFTYSNNLSEWIQFSGPSKIIPGVALAYNGNTLDVLLNGSTVTVNGSNQIQVGNLANAQISASAEIAYSKLANLGGSTNAILVQDSLGHVAVSSIISSDILLKDGSVELTGSLKPQLDNTVDLGESAKRFANVYAVNMNSGASDMNLTANSKVFINNTLDMTNHAMQNVNSVQVNGGGDVYISNGGRLQVVNTSLTAASSDFTYSTIVLSNSNLVMNGGVIGSAKYIQSQSTGNYSADMSLRQLLANDGSTIMLDWSGSSVDVNSKKITSLATCTADADAANKKYVDDQVAAATLVAGNGISIGIGNVISAVADPAGAIAVSSSGIAAKVDNSTIDINPLSDVLEVKAGGITNAQINASAAIDFFKLAKPPVALYSANHTASASADYKMLLDCTVTATLSLPAGTNGLSFVISGVGSGTKKWTIATSGGNTLDANVPVQVAHGNYFELTFLNGVWYLT